MDDENATLLKALHSDLSRKYRYHAAVIETIWKSFSPNERANCFKAGAADGAVLKHPLDRSLGVVYKIIPELNLNDIMSNPDYLLNILKYRATTTLFEQYCNGCNGGPGDHAIIEESVRTQGLKHVNSFKNCYTMFQDPMYATSYKIVAQEALAVFEPAIRARVCIPQSVGEDRRAEPERPQPQERKKKPTDKGAAAALSKPPTQRPQKKLTLSDLVVTARYNQDTREGYLNLLSSEPVVLAHAVNIWFFSRPELVPDEKGRRLPVHTDKYISGAVFEAVHSSIQGAAIWKYIASILEQLQRSAGDTACRPLLLQEISNICQLELNRAQTLLKRHIQTGTGSKWFKRTSNAYDNAGNPRVGIKGKPEDLTTSDPQLFYLLRLCQPKLTVPTAVKCVKSLNEYHETHARDLEKLGEREADALADLAIIVRFIQELSSVIPIPSFSNNKGQLFALKSQELESEFNQVKDQLDLLDFVVPIDNLLEPGMANGALKKLDEFVIEKSGTKMGFLYQDMVMDCLSALQGQCNEAKAKLAQGLNAEISFAPAMKAPESTAVRVEQRKQKEKTRPSHSSIYDIVTPAEPSTPQQPSLPPRTLKVDESTAETFSQLFCRSQSRGSVPWANFTEAMGKLGFSISPKYGSVYTFYPPDSMMVDRSFTVHRPHQSKIEGYRVLTMARRLKGLYGWNEETFYVE
ncbi:uncharacterized protein N7500_008571 [Penicillium coprophilum]|uniref:uncharacterized protein n=1 Tax=Penicillium coprophilum TaxID=36646 RepID=UPI00239DBF19|nr:uncharacterized protein N7500_008571 [Penicillium coprophilum]KAJ5158920.1 hypothetical protein N7500_008571 [Penicillium coprophilum]